MKRAIVPALACLAVACSDNPSAESQGNAAITSTEAQIVDLEFEGTVRAPESMNARVAVVSQLFYTIGEFTAFGGNARVGQVDLTGMALARDPSDAGLIRYRARLPVAWPRTQTPPREYEIVVPANVDPDALDAFNKRYDEASGGTCGKNEYGQSTFWHDFNSKAEGCILRDATKRTADVVSMKAIVRNPGRGYTEGKTPQYKDIWADHHLKGVVVMGFIQDSSPTDSGRRILRDLADHVTQGLQSPKETTQEKNSDIDTDLTVSGRRPNGDQVTVTFLLGEDMGYVGGAFDRRYNELTKDADFLVYQGHSGLSKNIRALLRKGNPNKGQYQVQLLNGCDSFAYMDTAANDLRRQINGESDKDGTLFLDTISNALPAWTFDAPAVIKTTYDALVAPEAKTTYNEILQRIPQGQVAVVTGEEDNP